MSVPGMAPASLLLVFSITNLDSVTHARYLYRQCRPDTQHIPNRSSGIAEKLHIQATWGRRDNAPPSPTYVDQCDPRICFPVIFINVEIEYFQEGNVWECFNCHLRRPCVTQFRNRCKRYQPPTSTIFHPQHRSAICNIPRGPDSLHQNCAGI